MPFAELPDARLFYRWDGPESAPVLIFSNSLGTTHRMWEPQVEALSKHFRLLRYDTRGHGQSSVTPGPYTIEKLATDVLHLLETLQIECASFCGLSMGGMIGMFLGATAADRLHRIILCNTAAKIGTPEVWNTRITAIQQGGMKAVASGVLDRWLTPGYRAAHPGETSQVLAMLEGTDPAGYAACCGAVRDMDYREQLHRVQVPALIVAGAHDPATPPADGRFLAEHIRGAKFVELPAAHLSNMEAREEFNEEILAFLKSQGAHG